MAISGASQMLLGLPQKLWHLTYNLCSVTVMWRLPSGSGCFSPSTGVQPSWIQEYPSVDGVKRDEEICYLEDIEEIKFVRPI